MTIEQWRREAPELRGKSEGVLGAIQTSPPAEARGTAEAGSVAR
jgi:hypothetical protein